MTQPNRAHDSACAMAARTPVAGYGKGRAPVDLCVSPLPQPPAPQTRTLRPQSVAVPSPPGAYHPLATGKVAAAATGAAPGAGTRAGRPQVQGFLAQAPGPSLLERWLDALAGVARAGRALALGLYSLEIVALLTHVGQAFGGHPPVVQAVERVYGALASNCQVRRACVVGQSGVHAQAQQRVCTHTHTYTHNILTCTQIHTHTQTHTHTGRAHWAMQQCLPDSSVPCLLLGADACLQTPDSAVCADPWQAFPSSAVSLMRTMKAWHVGNHWCGADELVYTGLNMRCSGVGFM